MTTLIVRTVCGLAAAVIVAVGMLVTAAPAEAVENCYEIEHFSSTGSEVIIINERGWRGHSRHGDNLLNNAVECPVDEEPV